MDKSDLFQALKGGSNNVGIVTEFTFYYYFVNTMWGGAISYPARAFPQLIQRYYDFIVLGTKPSLSVWIAAAWDQSYGELVSNDGTPNPPELKPFWNFQPQLSSTLRTALLYNITDELNLYNVPGARRGWYTTSFGPDQQLMRNVYNLFRNTIINAEIASLQSWALVYQVVSKDTINASTVHEFGPNALGLSPDDGPFLIAQFEEAHSDAADDAASAAVMQKLLADADALIENTGKAVRFRYLNYADKSQDAISSYGPDMVQMLKTVAKKHDPDGFFQTQVPGGHKLPV